MKVGLGWLMPHTPFEGPPLPRSTPRWPWAHSGDGNDPYPVVLGSRLEEVNHELESEARAKREELVARGVPEALADKAIEWAWKYAAGMARMIGRVDPEVGRASFRGFFRYALGKTEDWAGGLMRLVGE